MSLPTFPFVPFRNPVSSSSLSKASTKASLLHEYHDNLSLSEEQCANAFQTFATQIDDAVSRGKFALTKTPSDYTGLVQGRIKHNKLYILTTSPDTLPEIIHQRAAILHQLHRAIVTSPAPVPDTHFSFVINDNPKNNSWSFAHPNKPSSQNIWLMPHFSWWSWASRLLGTMDEALERISHVESTTPYSSKMDKVVWRGTIWFNPIGNPMLRSKLITTTKDKEWADVEKLEVGNDGKAKNALPIEDFCKYKYVVYTEGVTYSGRLAYHQACESVLLMPPLNYLTSTARLIRPIDAKDLLPKDIKAMDSESAGGDKKVWVPKKLLPTVRDWREANAIYVEKDWSNLEDTVNFLRLNSEIAETIAANQRKLTVQEGYLSSAAETCYWRALIKGWAKVAVPDKQVSTISDMLNQCNTVSQSSLFHLLHHISLRQLLHHLTGSCSNGV
ncbi:glycosyl transferase family 90-domain-containing protein [Clohesyomyces aquaticus]|uniref:Glycosyl transferase family 90-domain-containing protein n=1 Tax=Clohesyomyces aquaticus TaxID=1231657 RepID=A0A1Y2A7C1_9PLEO|nr:glycosyl transferase family 90-domain-containing protein [Clohesyomyces aquaticus]